MDSTVGALLELTNSVDSLEGLVDFGQVILGWFCGIVEGE